VNLIPNYSGASNALPIAVVATIASTPAQSYAVGAARVYLVRRLELVDFGQSSLACPR